MNVTSVLGEVRTVEPNESGEYGCPFCGAYVKAPEPCGNPVCDAGRWTTREAAEARQAERERRELERVERERRADAQRAASLAYAEARRVRLDEWHRLADDEGYCLECLVRSNGSKKIRHRTDVHGRAA